MNVEILFFGQLAEIAGCASVKLANPGSVSALKEVVFSQFPGLKQAKHFIALNNKMTLEDSHIPEGSIIAFMPPFSGG